MLLSARAVGTDCGLYMAPPVGLFALYEDINVVFVLLLHNTH